MSEIKRFVVRKISIMGGGGMQVYKCKNWLCNFEKTEHPLQSQDPTVTWAAHGS